MYWLSVVMSSLLYMLDTDIVMTIQIPTLISRMFPVLKGYVNEYFVP